MSILILAAAVRIPFLFLPPVFSDDVYRHRFDGRVLAAGVDPYRHAPSDPALLGFRDGLHEKINHPDVPTVYGPLAQALLALLALSPAGAAVWSVKALAAAFDLLAVASLSVLGGAIGIGTFAALAYAVHPLAVIETAGEGHLDGIAVALLLAALALLVKSRGRASGALLAAAALVKLTPLAAAPALLAAAGRRAAVIAAALFALAHLPFASSGGPYPGLRTYALTWEGNGVLYPDLVRALDATGAAAGAKAAYAWLKERLGHPELMDRGWRFFYSAFLARVILAVLFVALAVLVVLRVPEPVRASGLLVASLLVVSPTLHPWYLLHLLPFALLFRWTSAAWVAGAAPLVYLATLPAGAPRWPHPDLVRAIELLPASAFLVLDWRAYSGARGEPGGTR